MESANSVAASVIKRVKHWNDGEQIFCYAAAGFLEAEKSFHRTKGYRQITLLISAIEKDLELSSGTLIVRLTFSYSAISGAFLRFRNSTESGTSSKNRKTIKMHSNSRIKRLK